MLSGAALNLTAQTVYIGNGTGAGLYYGPLYRASATSTNYYSKNLIMYTASELQTAGIIPGSIITDLAFYKTNNTVLTNGASGLLTLSLREGGTTSAYPSGTSIVTETATGFTQVAAMTINTTNNFPSTPGWVVFPLTNPFTYTGGNLEIYGDWVLTSGSGSPSDGAINWQNHSTGTDTRTLQMFASAPIMSGTNYSYSVRGNLQITYLPGAPCISPPDAGAVAGAPTGTVCPGSAINLNLAGNTSGNGQTYVWESSSTGLPGSFTPISTASALPGLTVNPLVNTWYRAAVTCGGLTDYSDEVAVTVSSGLPGGTYYINSALTTGGNIFQSFADAATALSCGVAGPIILNVDPGNGPYNEQLILPAIGGTSATNTITINGNGATLTYLSTNTGERAVVKLNGTDYVTINNLNIIAIGTTTSQYGYGAQLLNDADNNTISNCTITINKTATSSSNYAGIVINSNHSPTAVATNLGASECDNNIITGNTVVGGYAGILLVSNGSTSEVNNNQVTNNTVQDFYTFGIYLNGNNGTLVEGNDISRPTRTGNTSFYGINMIGNSQNVVVNRNKIHDPYTSNLASTSAAFAMNANLCNAPVGSENILSNNLVYNFFGGGGNHNGFLNTNSSNFRYYHNTVVLDDASATCTTCGTRGIYFQAGGSPSAVASGIDFRNNIVVIGRGGTGPKQVIYFEGASVPIFTSNNNNYYITSTGGTIHTGYIGGSGHVSLLDWQNATLQEAYTQGLDPMFLNLPIGDLAPTNNLLDNMGFPVGILNDHYGMPRSLATPDIGAIEFPATPLSVQLRSFTAVRQENDVLINWAVEGEEKMHHYTVERSVDGHLFKGIGDVNASGKTNYSIIDTDGITKAKGSKLYYKLKLQEISGNYSYSKIATVDLNKQQDVFKVYPNPFTESLNITVVANDGGEIHLTLKDVQGRTVTQQWNTLEKGSSTIKVEAIEKLAKGTYYLSVSINGQLYTRKLIK